MARRKKIKVLGKLIRPISEEHQYNLENFDYVLEYSMKEFLHQSPNTPKDVQDRAKKHITKQILAGVPFNEMKGYDGIDF